MKTSLINKKIASLQKSNRQLRASVRSLSKANESRHFGNTYGTYSREDAYRPVSAEDYMQLYESYVHVFACVDVISQNLAKLPLRIYKLKGQSGTKDARGEEITDGPLWSLINRPNPNMTGYGLVYSIAAFFKLCGIYYAEKVGANPAEPTQLWTLRPDWMRIKADPIKMIGGYEYTVDGSVINYTPEEILRIKSFHPRSELYGLGIIQPATNSIITDLYATKYSKQFFKQGGHLQWYMSTKEEISDESFKRLEQQIKTKFAGLENAHAPAVLDSGLEIKELGASPDRNVLLPQKTLSRDEVCEAFRVPALMLGLPNETHYNNADAQYLYFWEQTEQPLGREVEDTLNRDIFWNLDCEVAFDYSSVKVLQPNVSVLITAGGTAVEKKIMTPNEVREKILKEKYPDLQPLADGDSFPEAAPSFGFGKSKELDLPTVMKLVEVMIKGGAGSGHHGHYPAIQGRGSAKAITKEVINDIEMDVIHGRFLDAFDKLRTHGVSTEDVNDLLERARKRSRIDEHLDEKGIRTKKINLQKKNEIVLHKANLVKLTYQDILDTVGPHYKEYGEAVIKSLGGVSKIAFVKKDMISNAVNSLDPVTKKMAQALLKTEKGLLKKVIAEEYKRVGRSIDQAEVDTVSEKVGKYLNKRIEKSLSFVEDTAKKRVETHLADAIEAGKDVQSMAKDIEDLFFGKGEEYAGQAQNIARTETLKFTESARFETIAEMGFTEKEWFHSGHDDARPEHLAADGEVVKMGEKFSTGLRFPGDPEGEAEDVCNCGCTFAEAVSAAVEEE